MSVDFTPEIFTADYVGEPGHRTFFLQGRGDEGASTLLIEKQQVALLAEKLAELLVMIDESDTVRSTPSQRDPALAIGEPTDPEWRVGAMGLAYDETDDRVVVLVQPVEDDDGEESATEEPVEEQEGIRFLLRRDQARAFVLHALAVIDEGRPLCMLCGLPMDPTGHACPASNGHRPGA
jgi:uncharacterized repeat protein (TIGR03847 family)